jgi:starch synthase
VVRTDKGPRTKAGPGTKDGPRAKAQGPRTKKLSILHIASEARPFAKTGGLADVLGSLPPALARLGCDVTVVLPRYRGVSGGRERERFALTIGGYTADVGFIEVPLADGARAILVDCPELYDREDLYGIGTRDFPDNARRFALLARAALEWAGRNGPRPSVIHAHDWQAGLAPVYLKTMYADHPVIGGTPVVFTIHNLAYQGLFDPAWLPQLDLGWEQFAIDRMEFWHRVSFLKGGINDADIVTTVSRRYAEEIQTPALGFGFDGILRARSANLVGILNGIDTGEWNPAADSHVPAPYSADDLSGKAAAKAELLRRYGLPASGARWIGRSSAWSRGWSIRKGSISSRPLPPSSFASTRRSSCSAPARVATRISGRASRPAIPIASGRGSDSMKGWPTSSRPARTCS